MPRILHRLVKSGLRPPRSREFVRGSIINPVKIRQHRRRGFNELVRGKVGSSGIAGSVVGKSSSPTSVASRPGQRKLKRKRGGSRPGASRSAAIRKSWASRFAKYGAIGRKHQKRKSRR